MDLAEGLLPSPAPPAAPQGLVSAALLTAAAAAAGAGALGGVRPACLPDPAALAGAALPKLPPLPPPPLLLPACGLRLLQLLPTLTLASSTSLLASVLPDPARENEGGGGGGLWADSGAMRGVVAGSGALGPAREHVHMLVRVSRYAVVSVHVSTCVCMYLGVCKIRSR